LIRSTVGPQSAALSLASTLHKHTFENSLSHSLTSYHSIGYG